jgi:hypothetical protein
VTAVSWSVQVPGLWQLYRRNAEFGVHYTPDDLWVRPQADLSVLVSEITDEIELVCEYALTFDGYAYAPLFLGRSCMDVAESIDAQRQARSRWDSHFAGLRCTLFMMQRAYHWAACSEPFHDPLRELHSAVCEAWEAECPEPLRDMGPAADDLFGRLGLELAVLPVQHRQALSWFAANAGNRVAWPDELPGGILLATRAKGIYKPAWSDYALSIRSVSEGPYADSPLRTRADGTWTMEYCQEGHGEEARSRFTNRALLRCAQDRVPVGVLVQHGAAALGAGAATPGAGKATSGTGATTSHHDVDTADRLLALPGAAGHIQAPGRSGYEVAGLALVRDLVGETFILDEYRPA